MSEITVSGHTYDEALAEGLSQLGVPRDLVDVEELTTSHDDTLPGAEPLPGTSLRLRLKTDAIITLAKNHLKRMIEIMGISAHIEVLNRKRGTVLNIMAGDDGALIIGRSGQTLDAIQYVLHRMISRSGRELIPLYVDSEGYREKRMARLEDVAHRAATRVLRTQREIALDPMGAQDRKVIHFAVKEMRGVHSLSRGEGEDRHVVISPAGGERDTRFQSRGRGAYRNDTPRQGAPARPANQIDDEEEDDNFGNR